jgi:hypothetical protein
MKQRWILEVAFARFRSKFLVRILHLSIQEFDRSITHLAMAGTNPDLPCATNLALHSCGMIYNRREVLKSGDREEKKRCYFWNSKLLIYDLKEKSRTRISWR